MKIALRFASLLPLFWPYRQSKLRRVMIELVQLQQMVVLLYQQLVLQHQRMDLGIQVVLRLP